MTTQTEALSVEDTLKLALEALGFCQVSSEDGEVLTPKKVQKAIKAIKAALETHKALSTKCVTQPSVSVEKEPVAWIVHDRVAPDRLTFVEVKESLQTEVTPLYIIPKEKNTRNGGCL